MSSHPNPGQPHAVHHQGSGAADHRDAPPTTSEFEPIKTAFASLPPAKSMADLAQAEGRVRRRSAESVGTPGQPVPRAVGAVPRRQRRQGLPGVRVPRNWTSLSSKSAIKVVPAERLRSAQRTDGVQPRRRVRRRQGRDRAICSEATNAWLNAVAQNNPELRARRDRSRRLRISQRSAHQHAARQPFAARRPGTHRRLHDVSGRRHPVLLPDDRARERRAAFQETFRRIGESIRLTETR